MMEAVGVEPGVQQRMMAAALQWGHMQQQQEV